MMTRPKWILQLQFSQYASLAECWTLFTPNIVFLIQSKNYIWTAYNHAAFEWPMRSRTTKCYDTTLQWSAPSFDHLVHIYTLKPWKTCFCLLPPSKYSYTIGTLHCKAAKCHCWSGSHFPWINIYQLLQKLMTCWITTVCNWLTFALSPYLNVSKKHENA